MISSFLISFISGVNGSFATVVGILKNMVTGAILAYTLTDCYRQNYELLLILLHWKQEILAFIINDKRY